MRTASWMRGPHPGCNFRITFPIWYQFWIGITFWGVNLNRKEFWRHPWLPKLHPTAVRVRSLGVAGLILFWCSWVLWFIMHLSSLLSHKLIFQILLVHCASLQCFLNKRSKVERVNSYWGPSTWDSQPSTSTTPLINKFGVNSRKWTLEKKSDNRGSMAARDRTKAHFHFSTWWSPTTNHHPTSSDLSHF